MDPEAPDLLPETWELLQAMPKAELHLHLDGSLRPATALALAKERGLDEGRLDEAAMAARLEAPERCRDQADLLRAFELPIRILQDRESLARVAAELVEDVAADGSRYVEIRWAPALHVERGLSIRDVIEAVAGGTQTGMARTGIEARLICVALRSHSPETSRAVAEAAVASRSAGVVGFDLAGPEADFPDPLLHRAAFDVARDGGLGITVHAGEWGGAPQIRRALELRPARIAHGAAAADDAALVGELVARRITLDLCPTSNRQAGLVEDLADHPLARLMRAGVPVTLSTDDRTVSGLTLVREYARALARLGLSLGELWRVDRHALAVAFLHDDEPLRARLLADFDVFAVSAPALAA
jgi:adenosine deaminase